MAGALSQSASMAELSALNPTNPTGLLFSGYGGGVGGTPSGQSLQPTNAARSGSANGGTGGPHHGGRSASAAGSGQTHQPKMSSTLRAGDELLLLKARCSELELVLAQQTEVVADLTRQNSELRSSLSTAQSAGGGTAAATLGGRAADGSLASLATKDSNYQLRKELVALTEQKTGMEQQLHRVNEAMSALQLNLTREIQKAKEEGERQSVFLRSQLMEAKEHAALLQEKLVGQAGLAKEAFRGHSMQDAITQRILITSDSVLHRLKMERPAHAYRTKYDVMVEFDGRHMVLSGSRLNVQLLKAEVLETLNSFYAAMTDPAKYVPAAKARESARDAEADHLRRSISTHEATIASLHTALNHAQERSDDAVRESESAKSALVVERQRIANERKLLEVERSDHAAKVDSLVSQLHESEETAKAALRSLQSEAAVGRQLRQELDEVRRSLDDTSAGRELAERTSYVAREQARATEHTFTELMERALKADTEARRADAAERELKTLREQTTVFTREREQQAEAAAREKGRFEERVKAESARTTAEAHRAADIAAERDAARGELVAANALIAELRERVGGASGTNGTSVDDITSRLRRVENENEKLRTELQRSFNDMKAMAAAMGDAKGVRERALSDVERLEMERSQLIDDRQRTEMEAVQARMQWSAKEAELNMRLEAANEDARHNKARADMLHAEYHAKLSSLLSPGPHQQHVQQQRGDEPSHDHQRSTYHGQPQQRYHHDTALDESDSAAAVRDMLRSRAEADSSHLPPLGFGTIHPADRSNAGSSAGDGPAAEPQARSVTPIPTPPVSGGNGAPGPSDGNGSLAALAEGHEDGWSRRASQSPTAGTTTNTRFAPTSPGTFGVVHSSSTTNNNNNRAGAGGDSSVGLNSTPRGGGGGAHTSAASSDAMRSALFGARPTPRH